MKRLLLLLLIFSFFLTNAQNYNCLQPGIQPYYTNGYGYLRSMRIDSVLASGSDTIFYPYHTPRGSWISGGTIDSTGGSWLGKKVIKQADGTFLFDNLFLDTVVIKTQANLGDTWVFLEDTSDLSYTATVTGIDTMTILGVIDSIKVITISSYQAGTIYYPEPVNNFTLILSKNFGFVRIFDLYTFPYHQPGSSNVNRRIFDYYLDLLLGNPICECDGSFGSYPPSVTNSVFNLIPLHNPTMMELYNFSVGEVLEFEDDLEEYSGSYTRSTITLDTVLSKVLSATSVSYTMSQHTSVTANSYSGGSSSITTITTSYSVTGVSYDTSLLLNFNLLPEEWNVLKFYHYFPQATYDSGYACPAAVCVVDDNYLLYPTGQVYLEITPSSGSYLGNNTKTYSIGYGISATSYNDYSVYGVDENGRYLYSAHADSSCGVFRTPPLSVNDVNKTLNQIDVFPNPAHNTLNITASGIISQLVISNALGQVVYRKTENNTSGLEIDISAFPVGIYIVKINNTDVRKIEKD